MSRPVPSPDSNRLPLRERFNRAFALLASFLTALALTTGASFTLVACNDPPPAGEEAPAEVMAAIVSDTPIDHAELEVNDRRTKKVAFHGELLP